MAFQTLIIGPGYTFAQYASKSFDIPVLLLFRLLLAGLCLLPAFLWQGGFKTYKPTRRQWIGLAGLALVGVAANQFFFMLGLRYTTPGSSSLLYACTPLVVLLMAVYMLRTEKLSFQKIAGTLVALIGVGLVFFEKGFSLSSDHLLGNFYTVIAVCLWSFYLAYSRRILLRLPALQTSAIIMMLGALMYMPIGIWFLPAFDASTIPANGWYGLMYIVVVNSVASYLLISFALSKIPASQTSIYMNLQPVAATLFSVLIIGAPLSGMFVVGGVITLLGVYTVTAARR